MLYNDLNNYNYNNLVPETINMTETTNNDYSGSKNTFSDK